jgi:mycofactocin glycosyltransferase
MTTPSISIIIPCFGHSIELEVCLRALEAQLKDIDFEVIVVDSAFDARVQAVTGRFPGTRLFRSERHLFPGAARNLGVRNAASENIAFLDADCVPSPGWVGATYQSIRAGHLITGGPILDLRPVRAIQWCDNQMQFVDFRADRPAGRGSHFPSCNLALSRAVFDRLGGFREDLMTGEDVLFSERAVQVLGEAMWFDPGMVVSHHGRETLPGLLEHQYSLGKHRGLLRLAFTPAWSFFARSALFAGPALLWRYGYIGMRTWQYSKDDMMRFMLSTPILLLGLLAWITGFYRGVFKPGDRS